MDFAPMADEFGTDRLLLRPWNVSDADWYVALVTERGGDSPDLETARERIATGPRFNRGVVGAYGARQRAAVQGAGQRRQASASKRDRDDVLSGDS